MPLKSYLRTAGELRAAGFDPRNRRDDDAIMRFPVHIGTIEDRLAQAGLFDTEMQASLDFLHTLLSDQGIELDRLRSRELAR